MGQNYRFNNNNRNQNNYRDSRNIQIKSAYNFVPLSEQVFFPDWSDKVSMDIPFKDGISGELTIELTADTDIYTRESYPRTNNTDNNKNQNDFYKITKDGEYAIPGTSIKGAVRNVLEIASFSKIIVDDKKYGFRDLNNRELYADKLTIRQNNSFKPKAKAGWLIENDIGEHFLIPCEFARIEQDDINDYAAQNKLRVEIGYKRENAVAKYKYFKNRKELLNTKFDIGPEIAQPLVYRKATFNKNGKYDGILVFTGQSAPRPSRNPKSHPKHLEFVFFDTKDNSKIKIEDKLYKEFCFIHSTVSNKTEPNEEWKYWKKKMQNGERVPVFYMSDSKGKIDSIGLAMMYRLPYKYSIKDATYESHQDNRKDFVETLFGYIKDLDALRGRVAFSTMTLKNMPNTNRTVITTVLGSPKPTFYPYYMLQDQKGAYKTLMNDDCKINGWKRYPYQGTTNPSQATAEQEKVSTSFKPLPKGSVFEGKIHLHNVKEAELGGLIWALTFGNNSNCHHSVGMAKPYGFGAATIKITGGKLFYNKTLEDKDALPELEKLNLSFVKLMEINIDNWSKSPQILNLLAMAQTYTGNTLHEYPKLTKSYNEFVKDIKNNKIQLPRHLTSELEKQLTAETDNILKPIEKDIAEAKQEKLKLDEIRKEQESKALELKKEQEAKAEEARKAAMSPEQLAREENMPKFLEVKNMFEKQKQKPFNIGQCNFFKDIYDICSKFKAPETLQLLKDLLKYTETGPKKNTKVKERIKEVKTKIAELFPENK